LATIFSIILLIILVVALILPKFKHWESLKAANQSAEQKLANIGTNISLLSTQDKKKISEYKGLAEQILPGEEDTLRVLAILDLLVRNSGMALDNFQVNTSGSSKAAKTIPAQTGGQQQTKTLGATTTQPARSKPASSAASYEITATLHGNLSSALSLIESLDIAARSIEVTSVLLSRAASTEQPKVDITFVLPLGKKAVAVSSETKVELASSDKKVLEGLIKKLVIDVLPSTAPLGQPEPLGR
jgi:hypothetical protein